MKSISSVGSEQGNRKDCPRKRELLSAGELPSSARENGLPKNLQGRNTFGSTPLRKEEPLLEELPSARENCAFGGTAIAMRAVGLRFGLAGQPDAVNKQLY
ncbi:hypothetical protein PtA15_11A252 [Puccinia triticina]|uniref:Uncharacterized protein n=1 Tax=Puccinia triticina TaxID=208348 RepID=A0ABY7D3R2_9BASI|nr:uncharacterized protein PtA15_11A252 [Puccinia triticina]WAQ89562.1 hypothetical protein PtA15_11A252 [Puccinia triticina]